MQPGNGVAVNGTNQVAKIDTGAGVVVTTNGTNYPRAEINSSGLFLYNTSSTDVSLALYSTTVGSNAAGSAYFKGQITSTSGSIGGWSINSTNIASAGGTMVLNAATGAISGGIITGTELRTAASGTRVEIGTLNTATNKYDNINFWTDATSGSTNQAAGRILVGGSSSSTASLTISAPEFDSVNGSPTLITLTNYYSTSTLPNILLQGNNIELYGSVSANYITSSPSSSTNGLRGITLTNITGTPSYSGNDGDIVLVWS